MMVLLLAAAAIPALAQKAAARYEIDAKRIGVRLTDRDALPRGREFVRLDSTYYVGWLYQGMYLYDRSADVPGYQRALPLLRKAFLLLEKDYSGLLQTLYNDPLQYMQNTTRYGDYLTLTRALRDVYEILDMPDSAMWVLKRAEQKKFRRDFIGIYGLRAWIIHRNRFYTSKDFSFLGNSVAENEQRALQSCYDGFAFIRRNQAANDLWFGEGHAYFDRQFIYHYLALIHGYLKNYDSSVYYYEQMANAGTVSWNNYGSTKAEMGEFGEAMDMFSRDKYKYGNVKQLMEPFYFLPLLNVYAGRTDAAMDIAKEAIAASNSSPGFGWYNIALARAYLYNGQLDSAWHTLEKAAHFKEIHIGTTLTQQQYDFTIGVLKLAWYQRKIAAIKFLHANWWYHPRWLYEVAALQAQQYLHEYILANQLVLNPERVRIIYDLFCGESTVGFDEIYSLMERFSPRYFQELMDKYLLTDPRPKIKPYFQLFKARLMWHNGEKKAAADLLADLHNNLRLDTTHEKLLIARLLEARWRVAHAADMTADAGRFGKLLFDEYPQLVPFAGLPFAMQLETIGDTDTNIEEIVAELRQTKIRWTDDPAAPRAQLRFTRKGIKYQVEISVYNGAVMRYSSRFLFTTPDGVSSQIVFRLFGSGGPTELDAPAPKKAS
jgi:hypothetical protein